MTSSFENPKTKPSLLSMSTTSTSSPSASDSRVVSSSPPKPAPRTTMRTDGSYPDAVGAPGGPT